MNAFTLAARIRKLARKYLLLTLDADWENYVESNYRKLPEEIRKRLTYKHFYNQMSEALEMSEALGRSKDK